ncbi:ATP synthase F1 subunit delta [Fimbriiglobus ruber]|uniref:ATP synthase subunit delta n=1 Tax=Fimbriiglobus ruber TaxID=1908690 RepID=A0A225E0Q1_9BACT|nr:ATP synthase F1 subunit delta [Fimbriiglobus ruber]OWK47152.1 ATP synthase delta chain [Fimbriiglobus ruber]
MATNGAQHDTVLEATGARARIARVYATALLSAAEKSGRVDAIGDELDAFAKGVLAGHPAIETYFSATGTSRKTTFPAIAAALAPHTSDIFGKFLGVLNQNGRLGLFKAINAAYQKQRDEVAGRVKVRVTSAAALTDPQIEDLKRTLTESLKAQPILDIWIDAELLGGLVVQVGDRVYDTSVRSRLENLRTHLMASGTHG